MTTPASASTVTVKKPNLARAAYESALVCLAKPALSTVSLKAFKGQRKAGWLLLSICYPYHTSQKWLLLINFTWGSLDGIAGLKVGRSNPFELFMLDLPYDFWVLKRQITPHFSHMPKVF